MANKLSIKSENLSYDKNYDEQDGMRVSFTYKIEALRDLFRKKDIDDNTWVGSIIISSLYDTEEGTFDDYADIMAITANGDVEYEYLLSDMEKLYLKEEMVSEGII